MHHFIWQKNVDFMKPKELICRFLVSKVGVGCLGFLGRGVYNWKWSWGRVER